MTTYKRDTRVTFTQMCIYIDENIYDPNGDVNKCYEYMYHIFYTLAIKNRFFNKADDYDQYALFASTRLFLRYKKTELKPIKSVLNYAKTILYPTKVEYQAENFVQLVKADMGGAEEEAFKYIDHQMRTEAAHQNDYLIKIEFEHYLGTLPRTIKRFLQTTPYVHDKALMHNLYLSCLLSVLNSVTMSRYNKHRYDSKIRRGLSTDVLLDNIYREERQDTTILYNVDNSLYNYVDTLVHKIIRLIGKELQDVIGSHQTSEEIIQSILSSPLDDRMEDMN